MFSKACEYGIRAIIYIATESLENRRVKIGDVAENTGSPEAFTAKILGLLTKHRIVNSLKGPYGGFEISRSRMQEIRLSDLVFAIDGDSIYKGCALGLSECNAAEPCPMHEKFVKVRSELRKMLETTTVYDLATKMLAGESILMR
ncbi:MAG: Rrf2 family transcriptional regulator [Leadbetterella sp.]|nr:Rrf2 family transcriptional regulator [Leadbetterella sp.]